MSDGEAQTILGELQATRAEVRSLAALVERLLGPKAATPTGDLTVEQFAEAIGRKPLYVYRRIKSRQIAVRAGGKPYQIPPDQVAKFRKPTRTT